MWHDLEFDASFLRGLAEIDAAYGQKVQQAGCSWCAGPLDRADYPRKPRGELGTAAEAYDRRLSLCCRREGCRRRATPPSLRFLGRKIYIAVLVVVASAAGVRGDGRKGRGRVRGVPARTVRRWLGWWQAVFALSSFWAEAKGFFSTPVPESELPSSLLSRFGEVGTATVGKVLRFVAPVTTTSVRTRIAMVA